MPCRRRSEGHEDKINRADRIGKRHTYAVFPLRYDYCGLCAVHFRLSDHFRSAGHFENRREGLFLRHHLDADRHNHGGVLRHPALYPDQHLRNGRRCLDRCSHWIADGRVPCKNCAAEGGPNCQHGGADACRYSVCGLRPGGYDRFGAGHAGDLPPLLRRNAGGSHRRAGHHDPAVHYQRVGNRPARRTTGI